MSAIYLNALGLVCALGGRMSAIAEALFATDTPRGVAPSRRYTPERALHLGEVTVPLPALEHHPQRRRSRNNCLLAAALAPIQQDLEHWRERVGPARVGVVIGTSTSGIAEGEQALRHLAAQGELPEAYDYAQQELGAPAEFLAAELGLAGPRYVVSTACSSGAKALASAARLLRAGMCDAVLAGGADSLCAFTIAGFSALEAVAEARCNPFSVARAGINIGEGAALFLVTREAGPVRLAGWGETSDAHHISAPEPSGRSAAEAMQLALRRAGVGPEAIDYLNLHGTGTLQNDAMEARAVSAALGPDAPASSTKPLTGHTLGAAGAIEAGLCWLALHEDNGSGRLPPHWWDGARDPALAPLHLVAPGEALGRPMRYALSNSFAFGGSNVALVLAGE